MKAYTKNFFLVVLFAFLAISCKKEKPDNESDGSILQLARVRVGSTVLSLQATVANVPVDKNVFVEFSSPVDTALARTSIRLALQDGTPVSCSVSFLDELKTVVLVPETILQTNTTYKLSIAKTLKGFDGSSFPGVEYSFTTVKASLIIESILLNGSCFKTPAVPTGVRYDAITIDVRFSAPINTANAASYFNLSGGVSFDLSFIESNTRVILTSLQKLEPYKKYSFVISNSLTSADGSPFAGFSNSFYTGLDSTFKFPEVSNEELLNLVQRQTFRYFYDFAHPSCGLARERNTSGDVVTIGGSGFGVMALIVGMERGFITRQEGINRLSKILGFLETCDRFHGAWPHWLNGATGKIVPFSPTDDGGDLVETSFMIQGLYTMRQYLDSTITEEKTLIQRINTLASQVEYDWFTNGQNVLFWLWSPNNGYILRIEGYNETLITYVLAASSKTHPVSAQVYHQGYARNGAIKNGNSYYGYVLPLGQPYGGPLFFTHYSFLGLDPRNLSDQYASYWQQNVNQSLINWAYCTANPKKYVGYGSDCWGLTASDNPWGYNAHSPTNDLGVITPSAAISSIPYTPEQSMNAIRHFYYLLGDKLWGEYGFYDAFDVTEGWWANSYIAIDLGPIVCMIENYRTQLLWNLFMSCPEIQAGLTKLGFSF
ncbi:MAG: glucoamylase family protein [Bacteroidales bacterium]